MTVQKRVGWSWVGQGEVRVHRVCGVAVPADGVKGKTWGPSTCHQRERGHILRPAVLAPRPGGSWSKSAPNLDKSRGGTPASRPHHDIGNSLDRDVDVDADADVRHDLPLYEAVFHTKTYLIARGVVPTNANTNTNSNLTNSNSKSRQTRRACIYVHVDGDRDGNRDPDSDKQQLIND